MSHQCVYVGVCMYTCVCVQDNFVFKEVEGAQLNDRSIWSVTAFALAAFLSVDAVSVLQHDRRHILSSNSGLTDHFHPLIQYIHYQLKSKSERFSKKVTFLLFCTVPQIHNRKAYAPTKVHVLSICYKVFRQSLHILKSCLRLWHQWTSNFSKSDTGC